MKNQKEVSAKLKEIFTEGAAVKIFFTAFLLVSSLGLCFGEGSFFEISFIQEKLTPSLIMLFLGAWLIFTALFVVSEMLWGKYKAVEWSMLACALVFSITVVAGEEKIQNQLFAAVVIAFAIIINYVSAKGTFDLVPTDFDLKIRWGIVGAVTLAVCFVVASIGVYRYLSYWSPNFDFGIWCNMFHNMREGGLPVTTCERDRLLSHFAVHFSPIYYLMLPFYAVFPSPVTLQILQSVVLYSGVIPLCIMAKDKGVSERGITILGVIYAFYPAIATGTFYDLHENCFLLPLLLWCFCFFEKGRYIPMALFAALTLAVKEDAFIYVLIFAVYVFFLKGKKKVSLGLALGAVIYFAVVSTLMKNYGNGIMVGRYDNFIYNSDDGLFGVVKTVLLNPGYFLTQLFISKDGDSSKIVYIFQMLVPLAFIPFATRKVPRYLLVVPLLMNIMTMYVYQPNIRFQYSFGITAFLLYAVVLNVSELGESARKIMLPLSAVASLLLFAMLVCGNYGYYRHKYADSREYYKNLDAVLEETVPNEASVACTTFILPHLASRSEIYEVTYHKENGRYKTDIDYVVFDMRYSPEYADIIEFYMENGYEKLDREEISVVILKKK